MKYAPVRLSKNIRRLRQRIGTPLYKKLPLTLPLSLHIDPCNVCNFKCAFCPTSDGDLLASVNRFRGVMSLELFRKIIDDIGEEVRRTGAMLQQLHLYKDGEPLLNIHFLEMAEYAKRKNIARIVSTTTNGSLLTEEIASALIRCDFDMIRISVEHINDEGYKKITGTYDDYRTIKEKIAFLFNEKKRRGSNLRIKIKMNDARFSKEEKRQFFREFRPLCDEITIDSLMGWSFSQKKDFTLGATLKTAMDGFTPLKEKKICPEPFSTLAINPDGTVSVCCVDWAYATIVGNFHDQNLRDIWNGDALRDFRMKHLSGKRSLLPACATCHYLQGFPESENLDGAAEQLIALFKTQRS